MLPCHHPCRGGSFSVCPTVYTQPSRLLSLPSPLPSVEKLYPPPHCRWWMAEGLPAPAPVIPGIPSCITPLLAQPYATGHSISRRCSGIVAPHRIRPGFPGICPCQRRKYFLIIKYLCISVIFLLTPIVIVSRCNNFVYFCDFSQICMNLSKIGILNPIDVNYWLITLILTEYGNLPFLLENYA